MKINKLIIPLVILSVGFAAFSCDDGANYLPKPRGYFRIDLPEKTCVKVVYNNSEKSYERVGVWCFQNRVFFVQAAKIIKYSVR